MFIPDPTKDTRFDMYFVNDVAKYLTQAEAQRDPLGWLAGAFRLTSVPADSGALPVANVTPTDEQTSLPAAAAEHIR